MFLFGLTLDLIGVVAALVIILLFFIFGFNGLVARRNRVQDAWAQIDVQLKRRYDLIPNLVNSVQGYMKYEKGLLTKVTELRSSIVSGSVQDKATANNALSQTLKSLFAVMENYPSLKANENVMNLQQELENTENKISFVRTSYNDYVLDYNNAIQQFPGMFFASMFHFAKADFFQAPDEAKEPVKVNLDIGNDAPQQPAGASAPKAPRKGKAPPSQ